MLAIGCVCCGCLPDEHMEIVLTPNSHLTIESSSGTLRVVAAEGLSRRYEWAGCGLDADPCPRGNRWYGKRGIYDPAPGFAYIWNSCDGISRPVVEEAQLHFMSTDNALWWMNRYAQIAPGDTRWTDDGLFVQWDITPSRGQLSVSVVQICINGERPAALAGATDSAIRTVSADGTSGRAPCKAVSQAEVEESMEVWVTHFREADEWKARRNKSQ